MFATALWGGTTLWAMLGLVALAAAALLVIATDERKRSRRFHDESK
jgi:anti-sigma-K factor RskA